MKDDLLKSNTVARSIVHRILLIDYISTDQRLLFGEVPQLYDGKDFLPKLMHYYW